VLVSLYWEERKEGIIHHMSKVKKRNPIIAGLLSILFLGSGQLYNGQVKKAIIFALSIIPFYFLIGLLGLLRSFNGLLVSLILLIAFMSYVFLDAVRWAVKQKNYQLKQVNSIKYYGAYIIGWYILIFALPPLVKSIVGYESFVIPTPSMMPSIMVDDKIMAWSIRPTDVKIGDIITFKREDGQKYLSRVIGLPGDKIEIIDDRVSINGQKEQWKEIQVINHNGYEYQKYKSRLPNGKEIETLKMLKFNGQEIPPFENSNQTESVVPVNTIYVLGDNRNNSMDSRIYGTILFENTEKKVYYVWWSNDKNRIGLRLNE